jgi:hypothetical protein
MFNSTDEPKKLFGISEVFKNSDEIICPITSFKILNYGCVSHYFGRVISLNENKEVIAKMNQIDGANLNLCLVAQNKDQVITLDQFKYSQLKSCSNSVVINE